MGGWFYVFFRLSQASESMSSLRCDATGLNSYVIPAMRCCRPQQLCHPCDALLQASTAMSSQRWLKQASESMSFQRQVERGQGIYAF